MAAAARVEAEITESMMASCPELTSESELTFLPVAFTNRPSTIFTSTATATITSVTAVYSGVCG